MRLGFPRLSPRETAAGVGFRSAGTDRAPASPTCGGVRPRREAGWPPVPPGDQPRPSALHPGIHP